MRKIVLAVASASLACSPLWAAGPKFGITGGGIGSASSAYSAGEPAGGTYSINGTTGKATFALVNVFTATAPASPVSGDVWVTSGYISARYGISILNINNSIYAPLSTAMGAL